MPTGARATRETEAHGAAAVAAAYEEARRSAARLVAGRARSRPAPASPRQTLRRACRGSVEIDGDAQPAVAHVRMAAGSTRRSSCAAPCRSAGRSGTRPAPLPRSLRSVRMCSFYAPRRRQVKPTARRIVVDRRRMPVQSSKLAAPCATSTSSPSSTRAPAAAAASAVAVRGYGRSTSVCPGPSSNEHLVAHRRRVDHEVGVAHVRRPLAAPGEDARLPGSA